MAHSISELKMNLVDVVNHIFLPRQLPGASEDKTLIGVESYLLKKFSEFISAQNPEQIFGTKSEHFQNVQDLFETWTSVQDNPSDAQLAKKISELEPGASFAFYVREQNSAILITHTGDVDGSPRLRLSSFITSQSNESIFASEGALVAEFPGNSIDIPFSGVLRSTAFWKDVVQFCWTPYSPALKTSKKAGHTFDEPRDVSHPMLVTQYVTSSLTDHSSENCESRNFRRIAKKVRDEVVWKSSLKPFRRSGLWMSIKVILQLELVNRYGQEEGALLYKSLVLGFVSKCSDDWCFNNQINSDLSQQMIVKISRRLTKLSELVVNNAQQNMAYFELLRDQVTGIVARIRGSMDREWGEFIEKNSATVHPLQVGTAKTSTVHKLKNSGPCLFQNISTSAQSNGRVPLPPFRTRFRLDNQWSLFPADYLRSTSDEQLLGLILYDFECYIFGLEEYFLTTGTCQHFLTLLETYVPVAKNFYTRDAVGGSRMVLTCLKIVQLFDVLAVKTHPMLQSHDSAIKEEIVQDLFVPLRRDAIRLARLEAYFRERNSAANFPSLIEEAALSNKSFSARFAASNLAMVTLRNKILEYGERKCEEKRQEVQRERTRCEQLRSRERALECEYRTVTDKWGFEKIKHNSKRCTKCLLKSQIVNCKVDRYEKPLPELTYRQNGIVFELMIPLEIACLREVLRIFSADVCSGSMAGDSTIHCNWTEATQISSYYSNRYQKQVRLGSTTKSTLKTHYATSLHVDLPYDEFILDNGFNCYFSTGNMVLGYTKTQQQVSVKDHCTFSVQPGSPYGGMQWALTSTNHTQNRVLASQSSCPTNLSLADYIEFGSLRAGHRLQYRNIFRTIDHGSLSFREESAFSLICQAIWEAGPPAQHEIAFYREAHEDISTDHYFTNKLLSTLDQFLDKNLKNWNDQYTLLTVIVLCNKILSFSIGNDENARKAMALIMKCREVSLEWIDSIEKLLKTMSGDSGNENKQSTDDKCREQINLRMKLVQIAAGGALTFTADNLEVLGAIAGNAENFSRWFLFIAKIDDNILLTSSNLRELPSMTRNLLRWVRCVGADLEAYFNTRLDSTNVLRYFAKEQWKSAPADALENAVWKRCPPKSDQWYSCDCIDQDENTVVLQMDIILGKFLVDGKPIGRLPDAIITHPDFQRMFRGFVFVVQTAGEDAYVTQDLYHDCTYKFQLKANDLVVTEVASNGDQCQMIPHEKFKGDIPILLKNSFSHWKNQTTNTVEFRSKEFLAPSFRSDIKYVLHLGTRTLIEQMHKKAMVDINSELYANVCNIMERLEMQDYIHLFYDVNHEDKSVLGIELPRMGLHFYVTTDGNITSKEYRGYQVKTNQGLGTLVGLQNGLLLTVANSNPIIFIPHGTPAVQLQPGSPHQLVSVSRSNLRKPAFYVFELDETLHRLKTQPVQSACLYLAHLHGLTSDVLPDPFTGLTGTESAMKLLQTPLCWTCEPMDKESLETLDSIEAMSPIRKFYPQHLEDMETVAFPPGIPSLCAHDAYGFIARKLKADSNRMSFAFVVDGNESKKKADSDSTKPQQLKLGKRAYWRSVVAYSPQAQIDPELIPEFNTKPTCKIVSSLDLNSSRWISTTYSASNLTNVRLFADLGENWELPPNFESGILAKSICAASIVSETASHREFLTGFHDWTEIDFVNRWLSLYDYARVVAQQGLQAPWTLMLSALAYSSEVSIKQLKILHAVAVEHERFEDLDPPRFEHLKSEYSDTRENFFNRDTLHRIISNNERAFPGVERKYLEEYADHYKREEEARSKHNEQVRAEVQRVKNYLENFTSLKKDVRSCSIGSTGGFNYLVNTENLNMLLKSKLVHWYKNRKLAKFIGKVEARLEDIYADNLSLIPPLRDLSTEVDEETLIAAANRPRLNVAKLWAEKVKTKTSLSQETFSPSTRDESAMESIIVAKDSAGPCPDDINDKYPLQLDSKGNVTVDKIFDEYNNDLKKSWSEFMSRRTGTNRAELNLDLERAEQLAMEMRRQSLSSWENLVARMQLQGSKQEFNALRDAGLLSRITPTIVLPMLCDSTVPQSLRKQIEATAINWTYEQKIKRCLRFAAAGQSMRLALHRELATAGYENWSPHEKPEWLLLQLEMDLMIRPVQVDVAEKMAKSEGAHSLMQLNMGEGKTSVIIPMLAARLATGSQLCRVTVLKSLYNTNKKMLAFSIGGLLNQRVYTFPCRRDMPFDANCIRTIQLVYEECERKRGVVMTVPEFRLSFQLKSIDKCRSYDLETAQELINANIWLRQHARDILDECDEILNVKYQLIYTIGEQQAVAGGQCRWDICQKMLKMLPQYLKTMAQDQSGNCGIELQYSREKDETWNVFPHCRILNGECYTVLSERIANDILDGKNSEIPMPEIPVPVEHNKKILLKFMTMPILDQMDHDAAMSMFETSALTSSTSTTHLNTILLVRGLLAYGVLLHGLTRRWRVNYGVNPKGPKKMAVPFRAKDVSSERTEFGHTDVAILLTQLSYYYSGLSNEQVIQCFECLDRYDDKEVQYKTWLSGMTEVDPSISTLTGINLADYDQTINKTIPALRKNMKVIDFWLANVVYPKESKQFPQKLTCTPWDLGTSEMSHPVTGFSGTNDTKLLLPLTISQEDLPELMGTNGEVLYNLLKEENNNYSKFPLGTTGKEMLKELVRQEIPLLLDVGALMIDLSNEAVAKEWLNMVSNDKYKAALYFNDSDEIMTIDHEGNLTPFNLSPYRTSLDVCLIYLDDVHTRGTDLKIPRGTRGCVTIGKGVTKDKLVQGCMRMRMLGNGHTVAFYASQEVDTEIRSIAPSVHELGAKEVIIWALNNSSIVTRDGFQHWVNAAANFYTKTGANSVFGSSLKSNRDLVLLGDMCCEDEVLELEKIYGSYRNEEQFQLIAKRRMTTQAAAFESMLPSSAPKQITEQFRDGVIKVWVRCRTYAESVKKFTNLLDEEQERELEHEQEEERQKERPEPATPLRHKLAPELRTYIANSEEKLNGAPSLLTWYVPLARAFQNTKIWKDIQEKCWGTNIYATEDFCQVVKARNRDGVGEYVRPVTWLISRTKIVSTDLLLLSPFEANAVKSMFTSSTVPRNTHLHMFAARTHPDHSTFWNSTDLTMPSGSEPWPSRMPNRAILNANLLLFSGSLFFLGEEEQNCYCNLLGFVPTPRNALERKAVEGGLIKNGWMQPESRTKIGCKHGAALLCNFSVNPEPLVQAITTCRHETLPQTSHVSKILLQSKKTFGTMVDDEEEE